MAAALKTCVPHNLQALYFHMAQILKAMRKLSMHYIGESTVFIAVVSFQDVNLLPVPWINYSEYYFCFLRPYIDRFSNPMTSLPMHITGIQYYTIKVDILISPEQCSIPIRQQKILSSIFCRCLTLYWWLPLMQKNKEVSLYCSLSFMWCQLWCLSSVLPLLCTFESLFLILFSYTRLPLCFCCTVYILHSYGHSKPYWHTDLTIMFTRYANNVLEVAHSLKYIRKLLNNAYFHWFI